MLYGIDQSDLDYLMQSPAFRRAVRKGRIFKAYLQIKPYLKLLVIGAIICLLIY